MQPGFVYLETAVPALKWDAKYATADNFTGDRAGAGAKLNDQLRLLHTDLRSDRPAEGRR